MNWLDWGIIGVVGFSTLLSLARGFVKEALSLAAWVAAFIVSSTFGLPFASVLSGVIENDTLRYAAAYVALFASTLILGMLLNSLAGSLIKMTGLSGADRVLGTIFGFARGTIVVMVLLFVLMQVLPAEQQGALEQSVLMPHLMMVVEWAETNFSGLVSGNDISWDR